jgi:hypothetical protein
MNAAVAASLALAPKAPIVLRALGTGGARGDGAAETRGTAAAAQAGGRMIPMISRGGGYDAVLQWRADGSDADIKGYAVLVRPTTSPYWEQEIYVGKVTQYTFKDVSIDAAKFGVKAIGVNGSESLVTAYVYPPRQKTVIETVEQ